eukprot:gene20977-26431_t
MSPPLSEDGGGGSPSASILCVARVRPSASASAASAAATDADESIVTVDPAAGIVITHPEREHGTAFQFDFHFEGGIRVISNKELHARLPSSVEDFFRGFNISTLVNGQTGSGKTHTMYGTIEDPGILPISLKEIHARVEAINAAAIAAATTATAGGDGGDGIGAAVAPNAAVAKLEASYVEVHNGKVFDLLPKDLRGRASSSSKETKRPISSTSVGGKAEARPGLKVRGSQNRSIAKTDISPQNSQSHAIFTLKLTQRLTVAKENVCRWSFVDLAGTGQHDAAINRSLQVLGMVMKQLSKPATVPPSPARPASGKSTAPSPGRPSSSSGSSSGTPARPVGKSSAAPSGRSTASTPARPAGKSGSSVPPDSSLTWLLKNALGGNAKTTLISTLHPSASYYEETIATLRFMEQASKVVNHAVVNTVTDAVA